MTTRRRILRLCITACGLTVLSAGFALASGVRQPDAEPDGPRTMKPLVIGIMPAADSVPLIVAEAEGYFEDEGLDVTLELFRDQVYREAALQANRIDATITDLVNALRSWESGADYRVLAATQGIFSLVTAPGSAVRLPGDWPTAPDRLRTGLLEDSIIFYVTVRMLEQLALDPGRIEVVPTTQIPVRLEMLVANHLDAAVLPEPVTRMAVAGGAHELMSTDQHFDWTPGVLLATGTSLSQKPEELAALLRAYDRAVAEFNEDPDRYRPIIVERAGFPAPTTDTMRLPVYRPATLPSASQVADVASWMIGRGLLLTAPPYDEIVAGLRETSHDPWLIPCAACN